MKTILFACVLLFMCLSFTSHAAVDKRPSIDEKTSDMEKLDGFIPLFWDEKNGKMYLQVNEFDKEFFYLSSLPGGVGSNDIGLDRGQIGDTRVVKFYRSGARVLLIQPNYAFRAETANPHEARAVRDSFAISTLFGFEVVAEDNGKVLLDATDFYLRDVHNVATVLKETKQGEYKLEPTRSAFYLPNTKNFPRNTDVEVLLTFVGEEPGEFLRDVVPTPTAVTVRERHSFIEAPAPGYTPRKFDPRAGYFGISFKDFASPVGEPLIRQFIARHRLKKKDPAAAVSEAVEPIVYYMDPAAPEPVRTALMEGASWWNQAFEAAGYRNAFQVKLLPADADPQDVRYNMIQWVHRTTRGWSYGNAVYDPRTGEIIKGHVSLGSQRVRQDYLIAEGLLAPYEEGKPLDPEMERMALARIRQLAAHEVGHTLGLSHNYYASVNDRASVMDYPPPVVHLGKDGRLDLSKAYATGIGEWDKIAIRYGYSDFNDPAAEEKSLQGIVQESLSRGILYITDEDARPAGGAHPYAHLWDNGKDAVEELRQIMGIRRLALSRFSENNIRPGVPLALLEETLVPIYMYHRYQIQAVSKIIGGLDYRYAVRGDRQQPVSAIPAEQQKAALDALLKTLQPSELVLPAGVRNSIPPRPSGYPRWRELFNSRTGVAFDALSPAESVANITVPAVLNPERAARLVEHNAISKSSPGLIEVIDRLIDATWKAKPEKAYEAEVQRVVDSVVLFHLMKLATAQEASGQVRAVSYMKLDELKQWLQNSKESTGDPSWKAHYSYGAARIEQFQKNPKEIPVEKPVDPPPGPPIGMSCE